MFDPRDFHAFAVECSTGASDEAACRSAITRAYYAAYLVTHSYVREKRIRAHPPAGEYWGPHERTIHAVGTIRNPGAGYIEDELIKLKRLRINADYNLNYVDANNDVSGAIRTSSRIIAWVDALP